MKTNVIYSWKTKNPSVEKLKAVADVLDVSVDYLLNDVNETNLAANHTELSENQKAIAKSIDPDISNDDCQTIIKILHEIMKLRISN
ncbi:XRE family transcriptional regulator [Lentilactobacillus buchneri]|uniref:helix-turn-helix domain-containing protein n=1 Tax=Lentilactobacillus buchneri TaxID=1581 RepID=UPI0021A804B9|nr:XRE family transcriptional regulator [Lentilactobacillus buchneri]MCT2897686.1 XRE family transcriptional regulator [Lentilactobacillus buchneri]